MPQRRSDREDAGVFHCSVTRKWYGQVKDRLNNKYVKTRRVVTKEQAVRDKQALQNKLDEELKQHVLRLVEDDETRRFEFADPAPDSAANAEPHHLYWRACAQTNFTPQVVVRVLKRSQGFSYKKACTHSGCMNKAVGFKGKPAEFCVSHGGGKCPHGRLWSFCVNCNPDTKTTWICSLCKHVSVQGNRRFSKGGSGLCLACETHVAAEAAAEAASRGEATEPVAKKAKLTKEHENEMRSRLFLAGYIETFEKGYTPRPGEFTSGHYFDYRCELARDFKGSENKFGYVDFVICPRKGGMLVFLEVDENEHKCSNYTTLCDTTRMWNICSAEKLEALGDKHVLWIRLNPNTRFTIGDSKFAPSNTVRCDAVCKLLDRLEGHEKLPPMLVGYVSYQMDEHCVPKIIEDPDFREEVKPAVLRLKHRFEKDGALTLKCCKRLGS